MKTYPVNDLILKIQNGAFDEDFKKLSYPDINEARERYVLAVKAFIKNFGEGEVLLVSAPGRTELSGNHTDHQGGCVLAASVNLDVIAIVSEREDNLVTIASEGYEPFTIDISELEKKECEKGKSEAIVRGIAKKLSENPLCRTLKGFDAYTTSAVPKGSGLSSSAAFEILIGKIFSSLFCDNRIDNATLAEIGFFAEYNYFGKPCGKMDQYACAMGGIVFIDFKNETPVYKNLNVSFEELGYTLFITDAGGDHANLTPEYAAIPEEMREVARAFEKEKLSQLSARDFFSALPRLRGKVSDRALCRALHYYNEVERVQKQVEALEKDDIDTYLSLMQKSGDSSLLSLQNIYPSNDIAERSVSLALSLSLNLGAVSRVHGGGFAGTIQALIKNEKADSYKETMDAVFGKNHAHPVSIRAFGGYLLGEEK